MFLNAAERVFKEMELSAQQQERMQAIDGAGRLLTRYGSSSASRACVASVFVRFFVCALDDWPAGLRVGACILVLPPSTCSLVCLPRVLYPILTHSCIVPRVQSRPLSGPPPEEARAEPSGCTTPTRRAEGGCAARGVGVILLALCE